MQRQTSCFIVLFLTCISPIFLMQSLAATQTDQDSLQKVRSLAESNSLDLPKRQPFHIKVSFDLYDLDGQQKETGTVEEWWTGPKSSRTVITGPSLQQAFLVSEAPYNRETYLAKQVLQVILHPIGREFTQPRLPISFTHQTGGMLQLDCIATAQTIAKPPIPPPQICTEPSSDTVALQTGDGDLIIQRDAFRRFHDVQVPSKIQISYLGRKAIAGNIVLLEDLEGKTDEGGTPALAYDNKSSVDATFLVGVRLTSKTPVFPKAAKKAHQHGSVTLIAIITKQGTLRNLDIVATPGVLFSQSAIDAVQTWTYQPYLLDTLPTEVETTITVNYSLGGKT